MQTPQTFEQPVGLPQGKKIYEKDFDFKQPRTPIEWMKILNSFVSENAFTLDFGSNVETANTPVSFEQFEMLMDSGDAALTRLKATKDDLVNFEKARQMIKKMITPEK